jgi:class 3 adenylate cyclase
MRNLVPAFILDQVADDRRAGSFPAVVLFVDTSGFTPLTVALMQHGAEGAEIVAGVLDAVFAPLVEIVYTHGGFVAGFAGDAFKAVFPIALGQAHQRAILAAWQIRRQMAQHPTQATRVGDFAFDVKVCVADGTVDWVIWRGEDRAAAQRAAYVFTGPALAACLEVDPYAAAGDVVLTGAVYAHLRPLGITATSAAAFWRLTDVPAMLLPEQSSAIVPEPLRNEAVVAGFFPPELLRLQVRGEFRHVVTVFINLQTLPAGDDAFVAALFRLLARDGGFLCRVGQIGDRDQGATLLLFWGAPVSYERNVARALNFVIDLQSATSTPLRAGITTNLAYAGFVGSALREEYTCYGTHVNLAARQMVMAGWGEIWLDDMTEQLAGADVEIAPHAYLRFKGFAEERAVFRLLGRHSTTTATFYAGAMVGRQRELAQLWKTIQPIAAGRFGGVVVITGEAGIGKSRLVHELQQSLMRGRLSDSSDAVFAPQWFLAQTDELLRQWLDPFRYWLRNYFGQSSAADASTNKQTFNTRLDELLTYLESLATSGRRASEIEHLRSELQRTRSFLGALVDLHWPESLHAQLEPELRFENTLGALKTLILAESLRRPVILHLEDAHWLDADSRTLLARLTHRVGKFPFAVVITMRPHVETSQAKSLLPADVRQATIPLSVLEPGDVAALAVDLLVGPVAPELVALVQARAEGNPFFAEQLLRYLQEQGSLEQGAAGWQVRDDVSQTTILPASARALLIARLDRLTHTVKEVVQTAAVLGREFAVRVLSRMLREPDALPQQLQAAEAGAIWSALSQLRYLFKHALLRDAAYDMQLRARLRALHQLAAESILQLYSADLAPQYATLAYHTEQADLLPEAARWYQRAGEQAAAQYANTSAIAHFDKALALTPEHDLAARREVLLARVDVWNLLADRIAEQHDLDMLQTLAQRIVEPSFLAQIAVRRMNHAWGTSDYAAVEALAPTAIAQAQPLPLGRDPQVPGRL